MEEQNEILTAVREGFARVDQQFAKVDEQFARVDEQFAKVDEQFKAIRAEFAGKVAELGDDLRAEIRKVGDEARLAHVHIESLRHDLHIFDEGDAPSLEHRVSALEIRVTKLERKRSQKKER